MHKQCVPLNWRGGPGVKSNCHFLVGGLEIDKNSSQDLKPATICSLVSSLLDNNGPFVVLQRIFFHTITVIIVLYIQCHTYDTVALQYSNFKGFSKTFIFL